MTIKEEILGLNSKVVNKDILTINEEVIVEAIADGKISAKLGKVVAKLNKQLARAKKPNAKKEIQKNIDIFSAAEKDFAEVELKFAKGEGNRELKNQYKILKLKYEKQLKKMKLPALVASGVTASALLSAAAAAMILRPDVIDVIQDNVDKVINSEQAKSIISKVNGIFNKEEYKSLALDSGSNGVGAVAAHKEAIDKGFAQSEKAKEMANEIASMGKKFTAQQREEARRIAAKVAEEGKYDEFAKKFLTPITSTEKFIGDTVTDAVGIAKNTYENAVGAVEEGKKYAGAVNKGLGDTTIGKAIKRTSDFISGASDTPRRNF